MNETLTTIYERRAIRKYKNKPVERKLIEDIIDAGRMAPSAINKQPWKFYVLTDKGNIKLFSKEISKAAFKGAAKTGIKQIAKSAMGLLHFSNGLNFLETEDPIFHGAPVVIFITAPKDSMWAGLDIGVCAQNMMLAAKSLGLDSCPIGLGRYVEQTKLFSRLNVPKSDSVQLAIIFGYGDENPAPHERVKNNVTYI